MSTTDSEQPRDLELARERQDLKMRPWVLFVVSLLVLADAAASILHATPFAWIPSGAAGIGLLAWIVRYLFPVQSRSSRRPRKAARWFPLAEDGASEQDERHEER